MLAVGDSTRLEIIFNTGAYRNGMTKSPTIQTNEGVQNQTVRIKTNIFVYPDSTFPVTLNPSKVVFPDTGKTKIVELYFTITNVSGHTVRPRLVSAPGGLVSVTLPKSVVAGSHADGSIKLKSAGEKMAFEKSITIEFDDTARTRFTVPVTRGTAPSPAKGQAGH